METSSRMPPSCVLALPTRQGMAKGLAAFCSQELHSASETWAIPGKVCDAGERVGHLRLDRYMQKLGACPVLLSLIKRGWCCCVTFVVARQFCLWGDGGDALHSLAC